MYLQQWKLDIVQDMNDDGIIYWKGNSAYNRVFRELERHTELDFQRTRKRNQAEIITTYRDVDGYVGYCAWGDAITGGPIKVVTDPKYKRYNGTYHVESHEVGHALGLAHDPPYKSAMDTGWDDLPKFFSRQDYNAINDLFF